LSNKVLEDICKSIKLKGEISLSTLEYERMSGQMIKLSEPLINMINSKIKH